MFFKVFAACFLLLLVLFSSVHHNLGAKTTRKSRSGTLSRNIRATVQTIAVRRDDEASYFGTGLFVKYEKKHYIMTNHHVIENVKTFGALFPTEEQGDKCLRDGQTPPILTAPGMLLPLSLTDIPYQFTHPIDAVLLGPIDRENVKRLRSDGIRPVPLKYSDKPIDNDSLMLISHANADGISVNNLEVQSSPTDLFLEYTVKPGDSPTERAFFGGSSGGGVYSKTSNTLIALNSMSCDNTLLSSTPINLLLDLMSGDSLKDKCGSKGESCKLKCFSYEGEWLNDAPHGEGVTVRNGFTFEGRHEDGYIVEGTRKRGCCEIYTGGFDKSGSLEGYGEAELGAGGKYKGNFQDGKMHGKGTMIFPDKSQFKGTFEKNRILKNSKGVFKVALWRKKGEFKKYKGRFTQLSSVNPTEIKMKKKDGSEFYFVYKTRHWIGMPTELWESLRNVLKN